MNIILIVGRNHSWTIIFVSMFPLPSWLVEWGLTPRSRHRYERCRGLELQTIYTTRAVFNVRPNFDIGRQQLNAAPTQLLSVSNAPFSTLQAFSAHDGTSNLEPTLFQPSCIGRFGSLVTWRNYRVWSSASLALAAFNLPAHSGLQCLFM